MRRIALIGLLVTFLASCAPLAQVVADKLERSDGATLEYVTRGVEFNPDGRAALGVIIRAEGDELQLISVPQGECVMTATTADCRLGEVTDVVKVGLTGKNVVANATWRREGASTVYLTFAQLPEGE